MLPIKQYALLFIKDMENQKVQEQLIDIYTRLKQLKSEGVKMKDIAERTNMVPSVLSALHTSVLPVFCKQVDEKGFDKALDDALSNVNNLSKKRLLELLEKFHEQLIALCSERKTSASVTHPFLDFLRSATRISAKKLGSLKGTYMSYSCSSSVKALKAEPFYFDADEEANSFIVGRKSIHNAIREGIGVIQERQILYLLLNAFQEPNMSLVTVYLQLPFLENIHFLKGIYLVPDYNKNPIARRIVLIKLSDDYSPESFEQIEARIIMRDEFTEEQQMVYDYTCGNADSIKMCSLPSPKLDLRDLSMEKKILEFGE